MSRYPVDVECAGVGRGAWDDLRAVRLDPVHLARGRVVAAERSDPAAWDFDLLRTRTLRALKAHGWRRIAVTSPTVACGKTFVAANLALSLARVPGCATVLMDLDLRIPSLAPLFGLRKVGALRDALEGRKPFERHFVRVGARLALGLNARAETDAAELLQDPSTADALARIQSALQPDVVIYDMPPVHACDDVLAFSSQIDAVLLVARGGVTRAEDIRRCERLFGEQTPILGVVLNDGEDAPTEPYGYDGKPR
jgi:Mrp family chromosome partitioning ATPase